MNSNTACQIMNEPFAISDGQVVSLHYVLKNSKGLVLDSSEGEDPLSYLHGADNIVPGLEKALLGRKQGDHFSVVVSPEEGYGVRSGEPEAIPREQFEETDDLQVGMQVVAQDESGNSTVAWVVKIDDEMVYLDMNHPLAGESLHFEIDVLELRAATAEELEHGHPHIEGGQDHCEGEDSCCGGEHCLN